TRPSGSAWTGTVSASSNGCRCRCVPLRRTCAICAPSVIGWATIWSGSTTWTSAKPPGEAVHDEASNTPRGAWQSNRGGRKPMSGTGVPVFAVEDAEDLKLGIVASRWHTTICDALVANAERVARAAGVGQVTVVRCVGAMELPVVAQALARTHD